MRRINLTCGDILLGRSAWYDPELDIIYIGNNISPFWLVLLHELGHHFINRFFIRVLRVISLDYEWDKVWLKLKFYWLIRWRYKS